MRLLAIVVYIDIYPYRGTHMYIYILLQGVIRIPNGGNMGYTYNKYIIIRIPINGW